MKKKERQEIKDSMDQELHDLENVIRGADIALESMQKLWDKIKPQIPPFESEVL